MRFTSAFNEYLSTLSPEQRERELEAKGYYAAGHGRPRTPGQTSIQGFPDPRGTGNPFSYAESMGSSMVDEAGAGFQGMASSGGSGFGSTNSSASPTPKFGNDTNQALDRGMQRFGMSADALRNIAKTVGIRRLDSSNDLQKIQDHINKTGGPKGKDKYVPGSRSGSQVDRSEMYGGRDYFAEGRNRGDYDGGRYGEFYSDLPDNTGYGGGSSYGGYGRGSSGRGRGRVMSPEELGIAPGQRKGRGGRGVSTDDVFGGRRRGARNRAQSFIK